MSEEKGMRCKKGVRLYLLLAGILSVSVFSSNNALGALVYTRLIDMTFVANTWYDYTGGTSGNIDFAPTTINGATLYTHGDVYAPDLAMYGTFDFVSDLMRDDSSGGRAKGFFDGGVTVEIVGGLKQGVDWVYGGAIGSGNEKKILEATLKLLYEDPDNPTENRWALEETLWEDGRFDRTLEMEMVALSEGLASGIVIGSDTLVMSDPKMDLSLKASVDPPDFVTGDLNSGFTPSNIKISAVPEPMTALLLGLGALWIRRKK